MCLLMAGVGPDRDQDGLLVICPDVLMGYGHGQGVGYIVSGCVGSGCISC